MNKLIDVFMSNGLNKYLTSANIAQNDYKKFLFMITKYTLLEKHDEKTYAHIRIDSIKSCFITSIENTYKYIPGYTPDQLFIISFDFFINSVKWMTLLNNTTMTFSELKHINFIASWYYYMINDSDMYTKFTYIGDETKIEKMNSVLNIISAHVAQKCIKS